MAVKSKPARRKDAAAFDPSEDAPEASFVILEAQTDEDATLVEEEPEREANRFDNVGDRQDLESRLIPEGDEPKGELTLGVERRVLPGLVAGSLEAPMTPGMRSSPRRARARSRGGRRVARRKKRTSPS